MPPPRRAQRSAAHDLERYAGLFSARTREMKSSAMRDLMAITERPEVISLAGGLPDTSTFPAESFAAIMARVAVDSCAAALQYGPTEGLAITKDAIRHVMAAEGTEVDPEDILVTTGGQQVIDLVCKTLLDPGDVVVAEAPTYPGAVPAFCSYQADVVQIEMDADGMPIDVLEETLDRLEREGRKPKFIYTIPNFQNPGGVTMSLPRRRRLVEVAAEREILVLEDNPYGLLRYAGEPLPTLLSLGGEGYTIYLGTFSKILSAGLRLGWAVAPAPVLSKMNLGKQATDLCSSSLTQHFVSAYFAEGRWEPYLESLRELYRGRRDVMLDALREHFPAEATWTEPDGGLFVWVTLPPEVDTTDLLARALQRNVAFVPGRGAYLDGRGGASMRLNFSGVGEAHIREGVRRIGEVIGEQLELVRAVSGARPDPAPQAPAAPDPALADVLHLPRPARPDARRSDGSR
ncbi:aminotransferase-like domain-containing protein [Baekduia soli]|uniref:aminotransferase-like domain-containing protein n=1 Tax=Baekduia soli TaxID=496014 RepID=UPI001E634DD2|nr:PLP-dependent aminotransferase family protein [Baekduia soli]